VSDYGGARVITVHISNMVFRCMHYIAIHTQWHSGLLLHQNYVILHTSTKSWYHCTKYHLAVLW
jgi:predicted methyltransferase MtxX (methanogen marker protein 4)